VAIPKDVRFFFVHVMKTAGGTLRQHIQANFGPGSVYPDPRIDDDINNRYHNVDRLAALPQDRRDRISMFGGHFAFTTVERLDLDVVTLTLLRDPVERAISYLRWHQQRWTPDRSLEEIYSDWALFRRFLHNHQVRMFARTTADPPSYLKWLDIDHERLEIAKDNVDKIDVLGLTDRFDEFLGELAAQWGWEITAVDNVHVARHVDVSPELRARIAEDNRADVQFYEYVTRLYGRRCSASTADDPPRLSGSSAASTASEAG
jgi:hypothetical protein